MCLLFIECFTVSCPVLTILCLYFICELGIIIAIVHMGKLCPRESKEYAQGSPRKCRSRNLNSEKSTSGSGLFSTLCFCFSEPKRAFHVHNFTHTNNSFMLPLSVSKHTNCWTEKKEDSPALTGQKRSFNDCSVF